VARNAFIFSGILPGNFCSSCLYPWRSARTVDVDQQQLPGQNSPVYAAGILIAARALDRKRPFHERLELCPGAIMK
jgi:hypothetical protein